MPKRPRSGAVIKPARVVAPIKRKLRQLEFDRTRRGALADQQIQLVVLHRRVKFFFERRKQAMNLVDEEHVAFLQVGQQGGDVAGFFDRRAGGGF